MAYSRKENNTTNYIHPNESNLWELHKAMVYDPYNAPSLRVDDTSVQHTSKNRRKVTNQSLAFYSSFQYTKDVQVWDEQLTLGATSTYVDEESIVKIEVTGTAGSEAIRQTRKVMRYVPGRQVEVAFAGRFGPEAPGIRRRAGVFDELNGVYFENTGSEFFVVVRRELAGGGIEEDRVEQEEWNEDRLDGTGPSGIIADSENMQLLVIEYEWYGVGSVEFKFVLNDRAVPVHRFDFTNNIQRTWAKTAFLPIRAEITNLTGETDSSSFYHGSTSVLVEGNIEKKGVAENISSPIVGKDTGNAGTFTPVLSIRLKADRRAGVALPVEFQAAALDNSSIFYQIYLDTVLTGPTWNSVSDDSFIEYDTDATALAGGRLMQSGYITPEFQGTKQKFPVDEGDYLGRNDLGTTSQILTISVASSGANKDAWAAITWIETR